MNNQDVVAAVVERNGRFLICRRPPHKRHGGLWEFPGGKVEAGEDFLSAARRELKEELSMTVQNVGVVRLAVIDKASGFTINFIDVDAQGEPVLHEHTEARWVLPADMRTLELAPTDREFMLRALQAGTT